MGSSAWTKKGKNPFDYLQSVRPRGGGHQRHRGQRARLLRPHDHGLRRHGPAQTVSSSPAPRASTSWRSSTTYQDMTDGSPTKGSFSPSSSTRSYDAVHTTAWAILALYQLQRHHRGALPDRGDVARRPAAGRTAGSPPRPARPRIASTTALAIQALSVGPDGLQWDARRGAAVPQGQPERRRRLPAPSPGGRTNAEATSAGIQAILALGEHPEDEFWKAGLRRRQHADLRSGPPAADERLVQAHRSRERPPPRRHELGDHRDAPQELRRLSQEHRRGREGVQVPPPVPRRSRPRTAPSSRRTSSASGRRTPTSIPRAPASSPAPAGSTWTTTTRAGRPTIGKYGLHLQLKNVPNGDHTYKIELRDHAGNVKVIERKFTVAVPTPTPTSTPDAAADLQPRPHLLRPCSPRPRPSRTLRRRRQ